jgi:outer membrane protein assembly factor BamA
MPKNTAFRLLWITASLLTIAGSSEKSVHEYQPLRTGGVFAFRKDVKNWISIALVHSAVVAVAFAQANDDRAVIIRSVRVEGNETTKDFVILREMSSIPGDTLNADRLKFDENRIYSLGLFNRVEIEHATQADRADLLVRVHERWYFYPFPILGIKYGKLANLFYGLGVVHTNFRGRNERLIFEIVLGFDRWVQLIYQTPRLTENDDIYFRAALSSSRVQNLNPDRGLYQQSTYGTQLTLGKRFGLYNLFQVTSGYEVWKVSDAVSGGTLTPGGRDEFFNSGINYTYDSRDVREYPTDGIFLNLVATKYGFGGSTVNFFRYGAESNVFVQLASDVTVAGRAFGQFSAGGPVPSYRYVYFGYRDRIRGYFSRIFEGENLVGGSVELRIPVLTPRYYEFPYSPIPQFSLWRYGVYAGIFADAGKTWFRDEGFNGRHWYSGFGAGLHFLLPYSVVVRTEVAVNPEWKAEFILDAGVSF